MMSLRKYYFEYEPEHMLLRFHLYPSFYSYYFFFELDLYGKSAVEFGIRKIKIFSNLEPSRQRGKQ